jgi:hypothetical protein
MKYQKSYPNLRPFHYTKRANHYDLKYVGLALLPLMVAVSIILAVGAWKFVTWDKCPLYYGVSCEPQLSIK